MARESVTAVNSNGVYYRMFKVAYIRQRHAEEGRWQNANGGMCYIKSMSNEHLFHTIQLLRHNDEFLYAGTIEILRKELLNR